MDSAGDAVGLGVELIPPPRGRRWGQVRGQRRHHVRVWTWWAPAFFPPPVVTGPPDFGLILVSGMSCRVWLGLWGGEGTGAGSGSHLLSGFLRTYALGPRVHSLPEPKWTSGLGGGRVSGSGPKAQG